MVAKGIEFRKLMYMYFCRHNKELLNEKFNKPKSLFKKSRRIKKKKIKEYSFISGKKNLLNSIIF